MLTRLTIHNLATIESLTLELEGGFTVLTGETGAGKSILIEAIRFVLGEKSSPHHIRTGTRRTMVEAIFDMTSLPEVRRLLNEMEIPGDGELTLRRMLAENGRSRAVANDCAITQTRLETLGGFLVNIHGQQDHQMLLDPATHHLTMNIRMARVDEKHDISWVHEFGPIEPWWLRTLGVNLVRQNDAKQYLPWDDPRYAKYKK